MRTRSFSWTRSFSKDNGKRAKAASCATNFFSILPTELIRKIAAHVITDDYLYHCWSKEFVAAKLVAGKLAERRATAVSNVRECLSHWPEWLQEVMIVQDLGRIAEQNTRLIDKLELLGRNMRWTKLKVVGAEASDIPFLTSAYSRIGVRMVDEYDGLKTLVLANGRPYKASESNHCTLLANTPIRLGGRLACGCTGLDGDMEDGEIDHAIRAYIDHTYV